MNEGEGEIDGPATLLPGQLICVRGTDRERSWGMVVEKITSLVHAEPATWYRYVLLDFEDWHDEEKIGAFRRRHLATRGWLSLAADFAASPLDPSSTVAELSLAAGF
jgi:hypothetical protein